MSDAPAYIERTRPPKLVLSQKTEKGTRKEGRDMSIIETANGRGERGNEGWGSRRKIRKERAEKCTKGLSQTVGKSFVDEKVRDPAQ